MSRTSKQRKGALLPALAVLMVLASDSISANHVRLSFSEPQTGHKVTEYHANLPISRSERQDFSVPGQCDQVLNHWQRGAQQWGNRVDRSLWWKVRRDCDYVKFLHNAPHPQAPQHDFVSGYDFMNANLRDLPSARRCAENADAKGSPECASLQPGIPDFTNFLPTIRRDAPVAKLDVAPCRLNNGIFRGQVVQDANGIHCEPDPEAPGFRVIAADYADVNGDGYLDVVLRLIPLGRGLRPAPIILPLTRLSADEGFSVPQNLQLPTESN